MYSAYTKKKNYVLCSDSKVVTPTLVPAYCLPFSRRRLHVINFWVSEELIKIMNIREKCVCIYLPAPFPECFRIPIVISHHLIGVNQTQTL